MRGLTRFARGGKSSLPLFHSRTKKFILVEHCLAVAMGPVSGRGARSRAVQMLVAAFWLVVACYSTSPGSCRPPCETAGCFNASTSCSYGTYPTCHGCCYRCAAGLGEYCSDNTYHHEPCGTGLVCIGTREDDPLNYPGQCQWRATSTPTTQPTGEHRRNREGSVLVRR